MLQPDLNPTLETPIRKLSPTIHYNLSNILNIQDVWKDLMSIVPGEDDPSNFAFSAEHIQLVERGVRLLNRTGAELFLEEWGCWGKRSNPTCRQLLNLLIKAKLFRAADYLAMEVLKMDRPERPLRGPAADIDVDAIMFTESLLNELNVEAKISTVLIGEKAPAVEPLKSDMIKFSQEGEERRNAALDTVDYENMSWERAMSSDLPLLIRQNCPNEGVVLNGDETETDSESMPTSSVSRLSDTEEEFRHEFPNVSQNIPQMIRDFARHIRRDKNPTIAS